MTLLDTLTQLSHEFGTLEYVRGGGGNVSAKNSDTLWIKPSGTTLAEMAPGRFVPIDRARLGALYAETPPADATLREALVKDRMAAAVRDPAAGRPSVETPLHDSFRAACVVHTHPDRVNGLTCARDGEAACRALFPEALWIPYTDPGYTLCVRVRAELEQWRQRAGADPEVVILESHGVFVAGDTADAVRRTYRHLFDVLDSAYAKARLPREPPSALAPAVARATAIEQRLRAVVGNGARFHVVAAPAFPVPDGPISPDHIVYMKSYPLVGEPREAALRAFIARCGYWPRIIAAPDGVYAAGPTPKEARLALDLAEDGARIVRFATAFGGIRYLSDRARDFIENWEVEQYRRAVAAR